MVGFECFLKPNFTDITKRCTIATFEYRAGRVGDQIKALQMYKNNQLQASLEIWYLFSNILKIRCFYMPSNTKLY